MTEMETTTSETDLSLFRYDGVEQIPSAYRDLDADERSDRIEDALATLGDDVVVLGHNYQCREILAHADFVGDSYQLSRAAAATDAATVVFAGVTFMAESADIITDDDQTVILPSVEASCPMAGMADAPQVDDAWATLTAATDDVVPVCYMNSDADLKAVCAEHGGLVCTSSNADAALEWALERGDTVLFVPDKHLGANTARDLGLDAVTFDPWGGHPDAETVTDSDVVLWDGYCQVHDRFRQEHVAAVRDEYSDATVIVHPECRPDVVAAADETGSTARIIETVEAADPGETWVIGTEVHLARHLKRWYPDVDVVPLCGEACMDCTAMGQIDPNYLTWVLEELAAGRERNVVDVDPTTADCAQIALDRMLEL